MNNGVLLMTALIPTVGHQALVEFSASMCDHLYVIISVRSFEPITWYQRASALPYFSYSRKVTYISHFDDNAPQNPSTPDEWNYWKRVVEDGYMCDERATDLTWFFASEMYGKTMADLLGLEFIPFDPDRVLFEVKGTNVRENLMDNFHNLTHDFQALLQTKIVLFGQESCGKSTMTKELHREYNSYMTHEFARPYLEAMSNKTVTDHKMEVIAYGQQTLEDMVPVDRPFVFCDTDLLSTIGYYRIYKGREPDFVNEMYYKNRWNHTHYIVMNDGIPFEEDALRYGGSVRESTKQFWINLLEEFGCNYYILQSSGSIQDQLDELYPVVESMFNSDFVKSISTFKRD